MGKATGPRYVVPLKRRRKKLTDYAQRLSLLKSGKPRFVVRKTSKHIIVEVVEPTDKGDKVLAYVHSKELKKYKWPERANAPTAYLCGFLCAKKAKVKECVLDIGLQIASKGAIVFAAAKGAIDAGMHIPMSEMYVDKMIDGSHIAEYARSIKDSEAYNRQFSGYIKEGVKVEELPSLFEKVKEMIGGANV